MQCGPQFSLRRVELGEADAPRVADLYARCGDYFLLQDGELPSLADARALFFDVPPGREAKDQTVFGWEAPDGLCAVAAILRDYPVQGTWYLGFMIVDVGQRGRGVGRSAYLELEDFAASQGANEIRLAVLEENEAGERFWRSLGFEETRRVGPDTFKRRSHRRVELNRLLDPSLAKAQMPASSNPSATNEGGNGARASTAGLAPRSRRSEAAWSRVPSPRPRP